MAEFMKEDFRAIFDNPHGTRRAIISRGRKNAKTVETAILMLLFCCGPEATPNSQLYSAARSRDQAAILFELAAKMVRLNPDLYANLQIRDTAKEILCPALGTRYKSLSSESSTAFGLSPRFVAHDECGQIRGPRDTLYEALETATAAQRDPLSVIISTQAPTENDLLSILIDDGLAGHDPRTVIRLNTAPLDLDPFSEEAIRAANPAFDIFMNKEEVLSMAAAAKRMPSRQAEYSNLVLNQRVEALSPFISRETWKACGQPVKPIDDVTVFAGLDLSSTTDLCALVLIGNVDGVWQTHPYFWLPADGLHEKARLDRTPYDLWFDQGFLMAAPGKSVDYEYVAIFLRELFDRYNIKHLAFDRWGFRHLQPWLLRAGFNEDEIEERFVEFGQGMQSMSPALRELEAEIINQRLSHNNHPVLTMCMANAVVHMDPAGNRKLDKSKSRSRIDGAVALCMAMGAAAADAEADIDIMSMVA